MTTTITGAVAPVVYGGVSIWVGVVSGLATALVCAGATRMWNRRLPKADAAVVDPTQSLPADHSSGQPRRAQSSNDPSYNKTL